MQPDDCYLQNHSSERLLIRPLRKEDAIQWEKFFNHPECTKYIVLPTQKDWTPTQNTQFWFDKQFARYKENRFGLMALINKETKEFIGQCGLLTQEVDKEPVLEIGYHLLPQYWGKGYATEAASFFKELAFKNNYSDQLVSIIDIGNVASEKVALRNGMTKWKTSLDYFNLVVNVFRIIKSSN